VNNDRSAGGDAERTGPQDAEPANAGRPRTGLNDPRALDILTAEHWSLLSTRSLGYQEMFGRTTIFVAVLSGIVIVLALLAQATRFGRETLLFALLLIAVALFIGITTFIRSVAINFEDARWVVGMNLLRQAYLQMVPELAPYFVADHEPRAGARSLAHGSPQRRANLANSLTTTSSVVAALNSVLAGALAADVAALFDAGVVLDATAGVAVSLVSAVLHVRYAARFRERHTPSPRSRG
jgi:type III secretory pathway component EscS